MSLHARVRRALRFVALPLLLCLVLSPDAPAQGRAGRRPQRPAPPTAEDGRASQLVGEGLRHAEAGRWEEAIKSLREAVAISPRHAEAHVHLGDALMGAGIYEEAFAAYRQAIHVAPRNADAHYSLGAAYNDMAQYGDAFKPFVQAIRLDPDYAEAYYGIGFAYQRLDNFREALGYLRSALRLRPDYPEARLSLGLTYVGLRDLKAAEEQLRLLEGVDASLAKALRDELRGAAGDAQTPRPEQVGRAPAAAPQTPKSDAPSEPLSPPARRASKAPGGNVASPAPAAAPRGRTRPPDNAQSIAVELAFWDSVKNSTDPQEFAAYLKRYPDGQFSDLARIRLRALEGRRGETSAPAAPPAVEAPQAAAAQKVADEANPAESVSVTETAQRPLARLSAQLTARNEEGQPPTAAPAPTPTAQATPEANPQVTPAAAEAPTPRVEAAQPSNVVAPAEPRPSEPERPATLEETLEWLRNNFSNRFAYSYTAGGEEEGAPPSTHEVKISYEPVLFQGCNLEWRDAADTLSVSLSELDPRGVRVEPRSELNTTFSTEVWNLVVLATGGARAFREIKGDGSGAMNSYYAVALQFNSRERAARLAERLQHAIKLCGGKSSP